MQGNSISVKSIPVMAYSLQNRTALTCMFVNAFTALEHSRQ